MSKTYQAVARLFGTHEWRPVLYEGQQYYCSEEGLDLLKQMTDVLAHHNQQNEYLVEEVTL